jgi:hypothetical protein
MTNKGINPLYVSALDVLIGTLGVFIVLNFLHSRLLNANPPVTQTPLVAKTEKPATKPETTTLPSKPANGNNGSWWRRTFGVSEKPPEPTQPKPADPTPQTQQPRVETNPQPPSPPQDPVAVDLMKQTQGAVVILLQQTDVAKNSVEMMLQQGSRTWKPSRASKYQDATFAYQKGLNYFYQKEMQPGTYDVMVRIRKGSKSAGTQAFSLFGKAVPEGRRTQTYAFGRYAIGGTQSDWQSAGQLVITGAGLEFRPRLPKAPENLSPAPDNPPVADPSGSPAIPSAPAPATTKKRGKWG